jgi:hypothetical protein
MLASVSTVTVVKQFYSDNELYLQEMVMFTSNRATVAPETNLHPTEPMLYLERITSDRATAITVKKTGVAAVLQHEIKHSSKLH